MFIPLLFMGGLIGRLFHEFSVTISGAILVSGFVSLTLTPMMCSRFLTPPREAHHGQFYAATERWWGNALKLYGDTLGWVMHHRRMPLLFSFGILLGTVYLFGKVPKGFLPSEDTGQLMGTTEAAERTSFESMARHQKASPILCWLIRTSRRSCHRWAQVARMRPATRDAS